MSLRSFRRPFAVLATLGAAAVVIAGCMGPEQQSFLDRTNAVRTYWHEAPLGDNPVLDDKAQAQADAMAARHALFHSNLSSGLGSLPWLRLGENVGEQPMPNGNPDYAVFVQFVNSSMHFSNMVQPAYTDMGVGVARSADGTVWVAEEFAQVAG